MIAAGLDVGSRTIAIVSLNGSDMSYRVVDTGVNPLQRCRELLDGTGCTSLVVTGYGRYLVTEKLGGEAVSEIKAFAVGARHLFPDCRTVIDIGGQDSKVILLSEDGNVLKFEMNDRCAAGTGKFLEVMAKTLEVDIGDLGGLALSARSSVRINSLCTVFADSEVVSLIAKGEDSAAIALGLHESIASRITNMVRRVGCRERVVFAGGGALNRCLLQLLEHKLAVKMTVPPQPQTVGALGAAVIARIKNEEYRMESLK
jgi:(R)-2-hydroxyacyl-CoA dehydratese activating ATPase